MHRIDDVGYLDGLRAAARDACQGYLPDRYDDRNLRDALQRTAERPAAPL